jgi:hypothetical protein
MKLSSEGKDLENDFQGYSNAVFNPEKEWYAVLTHGKCFQPGLILIFGTLPVDSIQ